MDASALRSARMGGEGETQRLVILHAGDVFLDGPVGRLRRDTKEHRREELRESFEAFMARVSEEGADAVVFSGNLLDGAYAENGSLTFLLRAFEKHPDCHFIITPGPRDSYDDTLIYASKRWPRNVHIFAEEVLGTYNFPDLPLTVYGWGFRTHECTHAPLSGVHKPMGDRFSLLCGYTRLEGEEGLTPVTREAISAFGAHYTALSGGIHSGFHRAGDSVYAYSGSFEGRDDSDAEEQSGGYVRIVATKSHGGWAIDLRRVPLDTYSYVTERIDVSHLREVSQAQALIDARIREKGYGAKTVLRVILCGSVPLTASFAGLDDGGAGLYSLWVEDRTIPTDGCDGLFREMNARGELYRHFYPRMTEGDEEACVRSARAFRIAYAALLGEDFAKY